MVSQRNNLGNPVIIPWKEQAEAQNPGKQKLSDLSVDDAKVIIRRSDQGVSEEHITVVLLRENCSGRFLLGGSFRMSQTDLKAVI